MIPLAAIHYNRAMTDPGDSGSYKKMRQDIRFPPEPNCLARVDTTCGSGPFEPDLIGLILDESSGGCGVVFVHTDKLKAGDRCLVQVGTLEPVRAEVRWKSPLEERVIAIGFQYLFE